MNSSIEDVNNTVNNDDTYRLKHRYLQGHGNSDRFGGHVATTVQNDDRMTGAETNP